MHAQHDRAVRQQARMPVVIVILSMLALILAPSLLAQPAFAAPLAIEPREIAVTPADLPPGFFIDPDYTGEDVIPDVGPMYQIGLARDLTEQNLLEGPVLVLQQVVRLDYGLGAGDALQLQRRYWTTQEGYTLSPAGPNDGGTFSLERTDDGVKIYMLGFIKRNMIIITGLGGIDGVVTYADVKVLAGITSGRLDAALGQ